MSGAGILPSLQQRPPVQVPPPSAAAHSLPSHPSHHDGVHTIFIMGLPEDVKERELQNFLRWLPCFEDSHLSFREISPRVSLFSTVKFAVAAKDSLQKMVFDAKLKSLLHIEMARKNLVVKRVVVTDSDALDKYGGSHVPPVLPLPNPASVASPSIHVSVIAVCCDDKSAVNGVHEGSRESITKGCRVDKSGCFTLFVENLPEKIHWERFESLFCSHGRRKSSTGVLRKSGMEDVSRKNHFKVEGVMDEEKLQVLSNCLVGWCKDFVKIGHLAKQMQAKGLTGFTLMRAAGNAILMIFEDNASLRSVNNDKSKILAEWFSLVEAWSESLVMECRRVWLVCEGVPFHVWNWDTFKNIADKWGLLLAIDESCQSPSSFDRAKFQVLTKADARIDVMVELKVGDNFFKVMVHEIEPSFKPNSWAPEEYESH
ncbi:receptor-like protein kinase-like [Hibiscus syriacus]|uniref:Receptor-like protein kinase-like n=1 Tax=Hibiscus syriacus TaxID=106335 RepID=A0A6A2YD65_HIBSY|nr:receptor-like protein kinase-like [Hibiscus syriacus]